MSQRDDTVANVDSPVDEIALPCARCAKPSTLCICDRVEPVETRLRVVILQHPQEDDAALGTAKLVALTLPNCEVRVSTTLELM